MPITVGPSPYQDPRGRSLGARIVEHGQTVHIGDHGRVVKFTRDQIPGGAQEFALRHQPNGKHWFAIVRFTPAGYVHSFVCVDRLEGARMAADGTHPHQEKFSWTNH